MPPAKKAAKKTAKKAAKKAPGHHHGKHHEARDLRRAYEHMGRVEVLRKAVDSSPGEALGALAQLAQSEIAEGFNKSAADLLRASEHLSFALLVNDGTQDGDISVELERSIRDQFEELLQRAEDHWEGQEKSASILTVLYKASRKSAATALKEGAYRRALEFARAAEALAHVRQDVHRKLSAGTKKLQLEGA